MKKLFSIIFLLLPTLVHAQGLTFDRSTSATQEFTSGGANAYSPKLMTVPVDTPRIVNGLTIEEQSTNLCTYSDDFDAAGTDWTNTRCSVTNDTLIFLDGTTTADTLHEDATGASTHYVEIGADVTNLSNYAFAVYAKENNRNWMYLEATKSGANAYGSFDLSKGAVGTTGNIDNSFMEAMPDGWYRCGFSWTADQTATEDVRIYVGEADDDVTFDGLDQDSFYIMGAQVEEMPFPTSLIHTDGSEVTRTADDVTMDPHQVNSTRLTLPEEFCDTCTAKYLTMYMEAKCEFSSSSDVGENRVLFGISGNTGTADSSHNRAMIYVESTGELVAAVNDDSGTSHNISTGVDPVNYDDWFSVRSVFDFSDLSRIDMWIQQCPGTCIPADESNAGMVYTNNAGTATFDTTNTKIRLGQWYSGTINANCKIRNLRITPDYTPAP